MMHGWKFEGEAHPTRGDKGDTAFLRDNYKFMGPGSILERPRPGLPQIRSAKAPKRPVFS